jgi:putative ABC transport system permease protein
MFTSFLKITFRNFYSEKLYALINISGLSVAIACCLILGLWLRSEFTFDRHNVNHKQIFRVINFEAFGNSPDVRQELGTLLARDYPEIRESVRFADYRTGGMPIIRHGENAFQWQSIRYTDDNVFNVFTHDIIHGDPETALVDPGSMAVSESFSRKYFGKANPVIALRYE